MPASFEPTFLDFVLVSPSGAHQYAASLKSHVDFHRSPGDGMKDWVDVDGDKIWGVNQAALWMEVDSFFETSPREWAEQMLRSFVDSAPGFQGLVGCVVYGQQFESIGLVVVNGQGEVARSMMDHESLDKVLGVDVQHLLTSRSGARELGRKALPILLEGCDLLRPYQVQARVLSLESSLPITPSPGRPSFRL